MNPSRLLLLVVAGCCFLRPAPLPAQDTSPPFAMSKQYSAELIIMMKDGKTIRGTTNVDGDKMRSDMIQDGAETVSIIRVDQAKIYVLLSADKTAMALPFDADKFQGQMTSFGPQGKFELIGPEATDGVDCIKYKVTSNSDNKAFFFWVDAATKAPVMMMAVDDSVTVQWKNYKAGPQAPSLFEPPADYQVITVPAMPGASMGNTPDGPVVNH